MTRAIQAKASRVLIDNGSLITNRILMGLVKCKLCVARVNNYHGLKFNSPFITFIEPTVDIYN